MLKNPQNVRLQLNVHILYIVNEFFLIQNCTETKASDHTEQNQKADLEFISSVDIERFTSSIFFFYCRVFYVFYLEILEQKLHIKSENQDLHSVSDQQAIPLSWCTS